MTTEQAYGVVVVLREDEDKFLLVKSAVSATFMWGFPKGHHEAGESPSETALRETYEEVGIKNIELLEKPPIFESYEAERPHGKCFKINEYFVGTVDNDNTNIDPKEISEYRWVTFQEALDLIESDGRTSVLKKAKEYLTEVV